MVLSNSDEYVELHEVKKRGTDYLRLNNQEK